MTRNISTSTEPRRSNVRELEGALRRVLASAVFTGRPVDIELVADSLKDLLSFQERLVGVRMPQQRIIRLPAVMDLVGLRRSEIYRRMKAGDFPASVSLGTRAVGWLESDVIDWINERARTRKASALGREGEGTAR